MGLKLNLFVHGVPKGQKIWGPREEDRIFIESFYSRKSSIEAQLQVDVIKIGKDVYCYFTYLRSGNILDIDNRQGSYFALTIRINAFYNDLFNMYSILEASYQKFILGKILKSEASSSIFLVDDFQQCDNNLKGIEKEIINYLSSFSNSSDFISLDNFAINSKLPYPDINLLECNNKNVYNYIKEKGNISISPFHPTENMRQLKKDLENANLEAKNKFDVEKRKLEQQIQILNVDLTAADKKGNELKNQLDTEKTKVSSLNADLKQKNQKISEYDNQRQMFGSKEKELEEVRKKLAAIKEAVNVINDNKTPENKQQKTTLHASNHYLPWINMFLTLLILAFITLKTLKVVEGPSTAPQEEITKKNKKIQELEDLNTKSKATIDKLVLENQQLKKTTNLGKTGGSPASNDSPQNNVKLKKIEATN